MVAIHNSKGRSQYLVRITITNTYRPILEQIKLQFGGNIHPKGGVRPGKPCWVWWLNHRAALNFLRTIYPYLIEKKIQAWLAVEFEAQKTNRRGSGMTAEEYALREGFRLALQNAKRL